MWVGHRELFGHTIFHESDCTVVNADVIVLGAATKKEPSVKTMM